MPFTADPPRTTPNVSGWDPIPGFSFWRWLFLPQCAKTRWTLVVLVASWSFVIVSGLWITNGHNYQLGNFLIAFVVPFLGSRYISRRIGKSKPNAYGVEVYTTYTDLERGVYGYDYGTLELRENMLCFDGDRSQFALQRLDTLQIVRAAPQKWGPNSNFTLADQVAIVCEQEVSAVSLFCVSSKDQSRYKDILDRWEQCPASAEKSILPPIQTDPYRMWFALYQLLFNLGVAVVTTPLAIALWVYLARDNFKAPIGWEGAAVLPVSFASIFSLLFLFLAISQFRDLAKHAVKAAH